MKKGLLIIAHGSPRTEANEEFKAVCARVANRLKEFNVAAAFLEGPQPDIPAAFNNLAATADSITVLPYFLVRGKHSQSDIPRIIEECSKKFPHVAVTQKEPLGALEGVIDLICASL